MNIKSLFELFDYNRDSFIGALRVSLYDTCYIDLEVIEAKPLYFMKDFITEDDVYALL